MRIIYNDKEANKKKAFFFYFPTREQLYECEDMLFGERKRRERRALLGPIAEDLQKLTKNTEDNFMFYAILKLLAEKEKEKAKAEAEKSIPVEPIEKSSESEKQESEPKPETLRGAPKKKKII